MINWSPGVTLEEIEEQVIRKAFLHYRNNKTATANSLGISIRTLDARLEKYALEEKKRIEQEEIAQKERNAFLMRARGFNPQVDDESQMILTPTGIVHTESIKPIDDDVIQTTSLKQPKSARGR